MNRNSIRRRLLVGLISTTAVVWLATAISSYRDSQHEVGELFDAQMAQAARTLLALSGHELEELLEDGGDITGRHVHFLPEHPDQFKGDEYEHKLAFQIWLRDKMKLMLRSDTAPENPLSETHYGYSDHEINGERWRILSLVDYENRFMVQVGENYTIRQELSSDIALRIITPMLLALPFMALFIWYIIGRSLSPLTRLTTEVGSRAAGRLDPVSEDDSPEETRPLVEALNSLFRRLGYAFENERRFTADAAHELRTPLAALKTQAQVAARASDDESRNRAIEQVVTGVDRASHLVQQLLTLARVDPEIGLKQKQAIRLCPLLGDVMAHLATHAIDKNVELELNEECSGKVLASPDHLRILLRNLVDNAIRYTPPGGLVSALVEIERDELVLRVRDSGPGIPREERERIFERFFRLPGTQQQAQGSGLGLSIVQRIAELHDAHVELDEAPQGGLEVRVRFPLQRD